MLMMLPRSNNSCFGFIRLGVTLWITLLLTGFLGISQASSLNWTAPTVIQGNDNNNNYAVGSPRVAVDANGNVVAVWVKTVDLGSGNFTSKIFASYHTPGAGWSTPMPLTTNDFPADSPAVAADQNGNIIVVWRQAWKTVNGNLYGVYSRRYQAGVGLGAVATVYLDTQNTSVTANADTQIAVDAQGNAVATWSVYDWGWNHTSVRANRYVVGSGWSGVVNLSTEAVQSAYGANVAMDASGNAMVVWSQDSGTTNSTQGVMAAKFSIGSGWGKPTLIESAIVAATRTGWGPQVGFDANGNALAVWYQYAKSGIYSNRYSAGNGWGTPQTITDIGTTSYDEGVQLSIDRNGNAMAVWNQSGGVLYANRYVVGRGWGNTLIADPGSADYSAKVALDQNGNAIAVWGSNGCNSNNIVADQYVLGIGWSIVTQCYQGTTSFVNKTLNNAGEPQLVIDKNGVSTVVWIQNYGVYASSSLAISPHAQQDCLFNWAEKNYANYFNPPYPPGGVSAIYKPYYYRYYSVTGNYLATSMDDDNIYVEGPSFGTVPKSVGPAASFLSASGC